MKHGLRWGAAVALGITACASAHAESLRLGGAVASGRLVEFDVFLPLRDAAGLQSLLKVQQDPNSHYYHQWLTPASFAAKFGPDAATMQKVAQSFALRGLSVTVEPRSLHVSGSAAAVGAALGTTLVQGTSRSGGQYLVAAGALSLPRAAADAGAVVLDFSKEILEAHTFSRRVAGIKIPAGHTLNRYSYDGGYLFDDLKEAYSYPSYQTTITVNGKTERVDGTGSTIGILMSSDIYDTDIPTMFENENFSQISGEPTPSIYKKVKVRGGSTVESGALAEASIDTQESSGGAPGAHVILYEIPSLGDPDILAGYMAIDNANEADVVSSSFGECDLLFTAPYGSIGVKYAQFEHELFEQGNSQGITFLASSGDESGLGCPSPSYYPGFGPGVFQPGTSNPADDTAVTAVGGTNLVTDFSPYSLDSAYIEENAWSDPEVAYDPYGIGEPVTGGVWGAGGGVSTIFPKPSYQNLVQTGSTANRTLPDVGMMVGGCPGGISVLPCDGGDNPIDGSGNTDRSYFFTVIDGSYYGYIGTSLSSPEFSSVVALLDEVKGGRMGNINTLLYHAAATQLAGGGTAATTFFHNGIPGYNGIEQNGAYGPTYNYTTGVGTPFVSSLIGLPNAALAGTPQTPSNP